MSPLHGNKIFLRSNYFSKQKKLVLHFYISLMSNLKGDG